MGDGSQGDGVSVGQEPTNDEGGTGHLIGAGPISGTVCRGLSDHGRGLTGARGAGVNRQDLDDPLPSLHMLDSHPHRRSPPERRRNRPLSAQRRAGGPRLNSISCAATAGSAVEDAGVIESQARAQKSGGASPHVKPEQRKLRARISGARAQEAAEAISAGCFRTSASGELRREYRAR